MSECGQELARQRLINGASATLAAAGVESALADARALMDFVDPPAPLPSRFLDPAQAAKFQALVQRRAGREPLQYITGRAYFYGLELAIEPGVFIPRPETEVVTEAGLELIATRPHPRVIDLCCGSGAIGLAIAARRPDAQVLAVEIDPAARALATANAQRLGLTNWQLCAGDATRPETWLWADETTPAPASAKSEPIALYISNPPYVPAGDVTQPEAACDPARALYGGGDDGSEIPGAIIAAVTRHWRSTEGAAAGQGSYLVMEHAPHQGPVLTRIARACGALTARTGVDLTGRERFSVAHLPGTAAAPGAVAQ